MASASQAIALHELKNAEKAPTIAPQGPTFMVKSSPAVLTHENQSLIEPKSVNWSPTPLDDSIARDIAAALGSEAAKMRLEDEIVLQRTVSNLLKAQDFEAAEYWLKRPLTQDEMTSGIVIVGSRRSAMDNGGVTDRSLLDANIQRVATAAAADAVANSLISELSHMSSALDEPEFDSSSRFYEQNPSSSSSSSSGESLSEAIVRINRMNQFQLEACDSILRNRNVTLQIVGTGKKHRVTNVDRKAAIITEIQTDLSLISDINAKAVWAIAEVRSRQRKNAIEIAKQFGPDAARQGISATSSTSATATLQMPEEEEKDEVVGMGVAPPPKGRCGLSTRRNAADWKPFGEKLWYNDRRLRDDDWFTVMYHNGVAHPKIRAGKVSKALKTALLHPEDENGISDETEQNWFRKVCDLAKIRYYGRTPVAGKSMSFTEKQKQPEDKLLILLGERASGNNNPKLINDIKILVKAMINKQLLTDEQAAKIASTLP